MLLFNSRPSCKKCKLYIGCKHPGISTSRLPPLGQVVEPQAKQALLVIGKAPSFFEDVKGHCWTSKAGKLFCTLLTAKPFQAHADIFLTNVVRCCPSHTSDPPSSAVTACKEYLIKDILKLYQYYEGHLSILCVGAAAAKALTQRSLTDGFKHQGRLFPVSEGLAVPVFYTYHPNLLQIRHKPALIRAVSTHLHLVYDVLSGARTIQAHDYPIIRGTSPPEGPSVISLDIETYGILEGNDQTVFHPHQACVIDKISPEDQIVTVGLAWRMPDTEEISNTILLWKSKADRLVLYQWLKYIADRKGTLLGKNTVFDVSFLKYCDPLCNFYLQPWKGIQLDDLAIVNHLEYDQRPERSLKPLAELFGVADYSVNPVRGGGGKAKIPFDKELWRYNIMDAVSTLELYELLWKMIEDRYGTDSPKLSPLCRRLRNQTLWTILHMTYNGVALDKKKLQAIHEKESKISKRIFEWTKRKHDLKLQGTGSATAKLKIITDSLGDDLIASSQVTLTPKTKELSTGKGNLNLILKKRPKGHELRVLPRLMQGLSDHSHTVTSFTAPLLTNPHKGILPGNNIAYPAWYAVPQHKSIDANDKVGGTIQGRITAQRPGVQTFPSVIKRCYTSRWREGCLLHADMSQIELRMAALLSGDPRMMNEYVQGIDRHTRTALSCFPELTGEEPNFKSYWRQAGKQLNFLMIYRGGPKIFQETLRTNYNIEMDLKTCRKVVEATKDMYPEFNKWQEALIAQAVKDQYLEVITGWSRTFAGAKHSIEATYSNEICNFPIQCLAAQLMLSAQYAILMSFHDKRLASVIALQTYDHILIDVHPGELEEVEKIIDSYLTYPPLMNQLTQSLQRSIPLEYESKVIQCHEHCPVN